MPPDLVPVILPSFLLPSLPWNRIDNGRPDSDLTALEMANKTHGDTAFLGGLGWEGSQPVVGPQAPLTFAVRKFSIVQHAAIKKKKNLRVPGWRSR